MSTRETIEPLALAARGRTLEGRLPISSLLRLLPLLAPTGPDLLPQGDVEYSLEFGVDEGGSPGITGWVKATLPLICQRCMETIGFPVLTRTRLGIVSSRAAARQLPERYEPLLVLDNGITVASIVEDELILALPQVAMHNSEECPQGAAFPGIGSRQQEDVAAVRRENPFAVLSQLKTSRSGKND